MPEKKADEKAEPKSGQAGKPDLPGDKAAAAPPAAPADKPAATPPAAAATPPKPVLKMPPPKGSHLKDDDNGCVQCHTNPIAWDENDKAQYRFYLPLDPLKKDVHFQKGVNCSDCHGGDPTQVDVKAHQANDDFRPKLAEIQKFCASCHEKDVALLNASPHKIAASDVPARSGEEDHKLPRLPCRRGCPGKIAPHTISASMKEKLSDPVGFCGTCHTAEVVDLRKSVHAAAGAKNAQGEGTLLSCTECHGPMNHSLLPVKDPKSPVRLEGQVQKCGGCHDEKLHDGKLQSFLTTVHGQALEKKGLTVGPGCADCHGSHNVFRPRDDRSTLYITHVADTCGKCHVGIEDRLKLSVHGKGGLGSQADRPAPGGTTRQKPTLHLVPWRARSALARIGRLPRGPAGSLRELPRRDVQFLCLEHARQIDRPGLRAGRQVRRLPRLA